MAAVEHDRQEQERSIADYFLILGGCRLRRWLLPGTHFYNEYRIRKATIVYFFFLFQPKTECTIVLVLNSIRVGLSWTIVLRTTKNSYLLLATDGDASSLHQGTHQIVGLDSGVVTCELRTPMLMTTMLCSDYPACPSERVWEIVLRLISVQHDTATNDSVSFCMDGGKKSILVRGDEKQKFEFWKNESQNRPFRIYWTLQIPTVISAN